MYSLSKGVCIVPSRCQPMTKNLNKAIPYINYRSFTGSDSGFVDIFHAEHLLPDICYRLLESSLLKEYFSFFSASKELTNFHIYYTKNQHTPRSWHVDAPHRKLFIYLTDVQEAHGPYSYQRNTFNLYNNHMSLRGKGIRIVDHKKTFVENFSRPKMLIFIQVQVVLVFLLIKEVYTADNHKNKDILDWFLWFSYFDSSSHYLSYSYDIYIRINLERCHIYYPMNKLPAATYVS